MSNFPTLTPGEAKDLIDSLDKVVITTHVRPDGDTLGTAKALSVLLKALGKNAYITCADPLPDRLAFIMESGDFVSPEELSGLCKNRGWKTVAVDVASPSQWGRLGEYLPTPELVIDHHALSIPFAPHLTVPEASSAAEALWLVVTEFIKAGRISLTPELALPLYIAISSDTGCFRFSNVTPSTLRIAAELIETGINSAEINRLLFDTKPWDQLMAEAFVASAIRVEEDGLIAYAAITLGDLEELELGLEHFETAIDIVRSLKGVHIAFVLKEQTPGEFKASMRSVKTDVAAVAARFGGGGHILAAGCTVKAPTAEEAALLLLAELRQCV